MTNTNFILSNTELGLAQEFTDTIQTNHCYAPDINHWYVFESGKWTITNETVLLNKACKFFEDQSDYINQIQNQETRNSRSREIKKLAKKATITNLVKLASIKLLRNMNEFDTHQDALGVVNGYLDLKSNTFLGPDPLKMITRSTKSEFISNADAPLWKKTLNDIFEDDQSMVDFFQRAVGYSLLGDNKEQCLFICHGSGANGKSLVLETIREVLGDYGQTMPIDVLLKGRRNTGAASPETARLKGVRFAVASESERGQRWSSALVKQLTGGDTITARHLYGDIFEFKSEATIWITSNFKPEVDALDEAMWRRMILIPFNRVFSDHERDYELPQKLKKEYPGILKWMVEGLEKYFEHGLNKPEAVQNAISEYRQEMDTVHRFIEERCLLDRNSKTPLKTLKHAYQDWCSEELLQSLAVSEFKKALIDKNVHEKKSGSQRFYEGIKLEEAYKSSFDEMEL